MTVKGIFCGLTSIIAGTTIWYGVALASGTGISADEALQKLMDGNKNYVAEKMSNQKISCRVVRESLAKTQKPYAVILSCSDSRVPPEIIFDKTLGEIFVVRVAGNVPDPVVLGSIEYAAEHIGSPLIMVLGHERCGAVTAAVEAKGEPEGNIGSIVKTIAPAVTKARNDYKGNDKAQLVETAVDDNIMLVKENLTNNSTILKELAKEGKIRIVAAKYDLDDGKVTLMK